MSTFPRELIFKERRDIDEFLSEPGLNSSLYEVLLSVREPNDKRYALKVTPLQIFNEAYGQALRVILDSHPEENYYNYYFQNARKYFERAYEVELVFCVVYVLLKFSGLSQPNIGRFLTLLENRMKDKEAYFPEFQKFCRKITRKPSYNPARDRFYLHTDKITPRDFVNINWGSATCNYTDTWIQYYVGFGDSLEYQVAMIDSIRASFELDEMMNGAGLVDMKPFMEGLKRTIMKLHKEPIPLPVLNTESHYEPAVLQDGSNELVEEIARLRKENEELKAHQAEVDSEERTLKVRDIVEIAKTLPEHDRKIIFDVVRLLIADQDNNWIEKVNAEERVLQDRALNSAKFRLANRRNTDFVKIISAMYDCRMFMTPDGLLASNKQDVMNEFGKLLQADLSSYSTLLSRAKDTDSYLDVFDQLKEAAEKYYNQ
jgi:hypothetical protein